MSKVMVNERTTTDYVTFLACTDDDSAIAYLNKWDVIDDYTNEKKEVLRTQGRQFSFTFGDYVVKTLVGSVTPALDRLVNALIR